MTTPAFTDLGSEYARNYAELKLARQVYIRERNDILEHLVARIRDPLEAAGLPRDTDARVEACGSERKVMRSMYFRGKYHEAVEATTGKTRKVLRDGFWFGFTTQLGPTEDKLSFRAHAFFRVGRKSRFEALAPRIQDVANSVGAIEPLGYSPRYLGVPLAGIDADSDQFTTAAFEAAIVALPRAFVALDSAIGAARAEVD